ncbi:serine hydrolase [Nigerium massiliense]|uniref:serine hydrolase n=1 Tax=Nigerium massiliense TaxID=1522317 RepID=UPI00058BFD20|nr:serine hydrolase [Nigerium massiliense]
MGSGVSRRTLLFGASAAAVFAGCARPPVVVQTPTASPTGPVREQLAQLMDAYGRNTEQFGLALRDLRSGRDYEFRGDYTSQSASMAKVMIVAMALRQARKDGGPLPFDRMTQASKAIIESDNDSADALWAYAGGPDAYQALANELQMTHTRRDPKNEFWSWTWTTPSDQRLLIDKIVHGTPALTEQERFYLLDLMAKTEADQTWGVGAPKTSATAHPVVRVWMKNGWVQFQSTDGMWAVNSMGRVEGDGRDYLLAMMSRVPTFQQGKAFLNDVGADVFRVMGSGTL